MIAIKSHAEYGNEECVDISLKNSRITYAPDIILSES
jgi:hypothetical protein